MKDVAVVRDVVSGAVSIATDTIKTYEEITKVGSLKLRVVVPGFEKDLFTIECKEKDGVMTPMWLTYTPPAPMENNNLIKPFPTMGEIRAKIRKYIRKEVKLQFDGAKSNIFNTTIEGFLFNHNLSMYGNELRVSLDDLEGFVLPLPERRSDVSVNITKTMVNDDDGYALVEAGMLLHTGDHDEFIGNTHLWLFALKRFMKEMVRQKVAKVAAKVRNIVSIHLEGVVDDPF